MGRLEYCNGRTPHILWCTLALEFVCDPSDEDSVRRRHTSRLREVVDACICRRREAPSGELPVDQCKEVAPRLRLRLGSVHAQCHPSRLRGLDGRQDVFDEIALANTTW